MSMTELAEIVGKDQFTLVLDAIKRDCQRLTQEIKDLREHYEVNNYGDTTARVVLDVLQQAIDARGTDLTRKQHMVVRMESYLTTGQEPTDA